jgi:nucleotide-binding universal stress UspA family protein
VLRASSVPVLTVRPSSVPAAGPVAIRHILCPVNNSLPARRALRVATALAACFGARVTAVHVKGGQASDWIPDLCAWLAENKSGDCETRETIRQGDPATEIVSATAEIDCDLAVIGARHRAFFDSTVLGATTVRVVRHARCPVLTVVGQETQPQ